MVSGVVEQIAIATEHEQLPVPVESVQAVAGRGLEGDRHFDPAGVAPDEELTLIAVEALDDLLAETGTKLSHEASRRNVLTRGIDLNALVGRRFTLGDVLCEGIELCEPCRHLQSLTEPAVLRGLVHRGGLRASVLRTGRISVGDAVLQA
jgi:MOSC domain-containing protein YiiM